MRRPLRGALIGFGCVAENVHLPGFQEFVESPRDRGVFEIRAVADPCEARRDRVRHLLPHALVYEDHCRLLEREGASLDFVDVTAPSGAHARIVEDALSRHLHVLCETPLATSLEGARAMVRRARIVNRVLYPLQHDRYTEAGRAARTILASNAIGKVRLATIQAFLPHHPRGVSEWKPNWRRNHQMAGRGIAMDLGSQVFGLCFEWFGAHPRSITARAYATDHRETDDNFACSLSFPTGTATVQLSWTAGLHSTRFSIHGEWGAILVDDDEVTLHVPHTRIGGLSHEVRAFATGDQAKKFASGDQILDERTLLGPSAGRRLRRTPFREALDEFRDAMGAQEWVGREATDALMCISTILAGYESASRRGREVEIPEVGLRPPTHCGSDRRAASSTFARSASGQCERA